MKVALVHYWLVTMRGGEKVLETIGEIFPAADIFTLVLNEKNLSDSLRKHNIHTSFIQKLPFASSKYQTYLPLMPYAIEQFNLDKYDLIISSDTSVAKGVVTKTEIPHICYCHTPMRYAWDLYHEYKELEAKGFIKKFAMSYFMNYIRIWDFAAAARVDHFIANSENVKKRIFKNYRRESEVICPPVYTDKFVSTGKDGRYYLLLGQLVPYKRADLAVKAFNLNGKPLKIIGVGNQLEYIKTIAKNNIEILGSCSFDEIKEAYENCKAFIFPGEEDFGITPLEAQASGKPVIAFAKGGILETVKGVWADSEEENFDNKTGVFFREQTETSLNGAINFFEKNSSKFNPNLIKDHADEFKKENFIMKFKNFLNEKIGLKL